MDPLIVDTLKKLREISPVYVIGVDVGGTNTRVAVSLLNGENVVAAKFLSSTIHQLVEGLTLVSEPLLALMGGHPVGAALAIAGPVKDREAEVTNYVGSAEGRTLRIEQLPPSIFPAGHTKFVNDLESCCYGILALDEHNQLSHYFEPLWGGDSNVKLAPAHHAVLAAGTGLGVGLLVKLGTNVPFQVYPLEFGHVLIGPLGKTNPEKELDTKLLQYLSEKLYDGKFAPEFEDVVSGRGLTYVYDFLVKDLSNTPNGLTAQEIVIAGTTQPINEYALKALQIHYKMLLRTAQTLAVGVQAKGILLAGDNQVANLPFVKSYAHELQAEFLNHQKRHWIEHVPVYTQNKLFNINLHGTLFVARSVASK